MSIFNKNKNDNSNSVNPDVEFYNQVLGTLHKEFIDNCFLEKDIFFIPEVFEKGQKSVLEILQNDEVKKPCRTPEDYYYVVAIMSFCHGMFFADLWHNDFDQFKKTFDEISYDESSVSFAGNFLEDYYGLDDFTRQGFFKNIFELWKELILPYMNDSKAREYIFTSFNAVFNLGVCFVLEQYEF